MPGVPVVVPDPQLPTVTAPPSPAATSYDPSATVRLEVGRQVAAYAELGVLAVLGLDADAVLTQLEPALAMLAGQEAALADGAWSSLPDDAVPVVVVLPGAGDNAVVPAMRRGTKVGVSVIPDDELATYRALAHLPEVTRDAAPRPYLLARVDTGSDLCGVTPENALAAITGRDRSPLTIAEGVALTVVRPDVLRPNRCYSLAGSRTGTNQRVPAVWISERRAKLGWCWDRNPHTWLGTASAGERVVG